MHADAIEPLLVGIKAVAQLLSVSVRTVYSMDAAGTLGPMPVRAGDRRLWSLTELRRWADAGCLNRERWLDMERRRR